MDRNILKEYPYKGEFFRIEIDESLPLNEREPKKILVAEVECDITQKSDSIKENSTLGDYEVYVKFDPTTEQIKVKKGDSFVGSQYGLSVSGKVNAIYPSQLGGYKVIITSSED